MWSKEHFRKQITAEIVQRCCTKSARRLHKVCKASAQSVQRTSISDTTRLDKKSMPSAQVIPSKENV